MGKLVRHNLWHSTCNSHTANLLATVVLDKFCAENVLAVMKEFMHVDFEKQKLLIKWRLRKLIFHA